MSRNQPVALMANTAFNPPKPNEFDNAARMRSARASLGT